MRTFAMLLSLALPLLASAANLGAAHHGVARRGHHNQVSKRTTSNETSLEKRFSAARWTFYDVGLGACGKYNGPSDFIVALNTAQFGGGYPGPHCFQTITMTYNGKSTQATIMDECPGCPYGGLDLSRGLFNFFASEAAGVIYGEWDFGGGGGGDPPPPPPPPKTTSKKDPPPPPTTTKEKPSPTPTSTEQATTSTSDKASTTTTTTTSAKPSSTSSSAAPVATALSGNLNDLNNILISIGQVAVAGAIAK